MIGCQGDVVCTHLLANTITQMNGFGISPEHVLRYITFVLLFVWPKDVRPADLVYYPWLYSCDSV